MAALVLAVLVFQQWRGQAWLPRTPFDRQAAVYLLRNNRADALIATRPDQYSMQACLNHPIMTSLALPICPVSQPTLGPAVDKLYHEIYGINLSTYVGQQRNWTAVWRERGKSEWTRLANAYGFQFVLAPNHVGIDLPAVLIGETESLYEVPKL